MEQIRDQLWRWNIDWYGSEDNLHWKVGKTSVNMNKLYSSYMADRMKFLSLPLDTISFC